MKLPETTRLVGARICDEGDDVMLVTRLGAQKPAFGLYFNCLERGGAFYRSPDVDTVAIREHFGDFPLLGASTQGEYVPLGQKNLRHAFTGVLVLITERAA